MSPTIFISAGEASGEHYGALLIEALKTQLAARGQTAQFFGMGSSRMELAGLELVTRSENVAVMGVTEIVRQLPRIYGEFRKLRQSIRDRKPDIAILIDFPDIHFKLAEEFHSLGIPVIFFVSPQLWAWKKHRIELVRKYVRRMLVIFPFEEPFYRERGIQADFVGHPLADLPLPTISREQFAAGNWLDPSKTWIGLLPGSRPKEIADHLPDLLEAARVLAGLPGKAPEGSDFVGSRPNSVWAVPPRKDNERYAFVVPLAPTLSPAQREDVRKIVSEQDDGLYIRIVEDARATLHHACASVVASGTATVEAALIGNPFVVVYRVSPITYAVAKRFVRVPHVAMANLIAGKRVVPELIQHDFTAQNIVQHLERLLPDGPERQSMMQELETVGSALRARSAGVGPDGHTAIERVAAITLAELDAARQSGTLNS
jgi:lipid-A-disaccharide synthase